MCRVPNGTAARKRRFITAQSYLSTLTNADISPKRQRRSVRMASLEGGRDWRRGRSPSEQRSTLFLASALALRACVCNPPHFKAELGRDFVIGVRHESVE